MGSRAFSSLLPFASRVFKAHVKLCRERFDIKLLYYDLYRSPEEQTKLYAEGRTNSNRKKTNAEAGQSWHQYKVAGDCVPVIDGLAVWDTSHPSWEHVGTMGEALGLDWSGRWVTFKETSHFQLTCELELTHVKTMSEHCLNEYLINWYTQSGMLKTLLIAEGK